MSTQPDPIARDVKERLSAFYLYVAVSSRGRYVTDDEREDWHDFEPWDGEDYMEVDPDGHVWMLNPDSPAYGVDVTEVLASAGCLTDSRDWIIACKVTLDPPPPLTTACANCGKGIDLSTQRVFNGQGTNSVFCSWACSAGPCPTSETDNPEPPQWLDECPAGDRREFTESVGVTSRVWVVDRRPLPPSTVAEPEGAEDMEPFATRSLAEIHDEIRRQWAEGTGIGS